MFDASMLQQTTNNKQQTTAALRASNRERPAGTELRVYCLLEATEKTERVQGVDGPARGARSGGGRQPPKTVLRQVSQERDDRTA